MRVRTSSVPVVRSGSVRVAVIIGGAFQSLVATPESLRCDAVLYLDVASEIRAVRTKKGVLTLKLANGETIGTLMLSAKCDAKLREYLQNHSAVNLSDGLAQLRGVGDLAVKKFVATPYFRQFLRRKLFGPLLITHNGAIDELNLRFYASGGGGTGGPGLQIVANAIRDMFVDHFNATVQLDIFRCGSMTFEGVGDRVHANTAATIAEDAAWIASSDRHPREVRRGYFFELPMVEGNRAARARYAREVVQALACDGISQQFGLHAPNSAYDSRYGGISIIRPFWFASLPPRAVAAEVAHVYRRRLSAAVNARPLANAVATIELVVSNDKPIRVRRSVEDVIAATRNAGGIEPAGFEEDCLAVQFRSSGTVVAQMTDGRRFNVTKNARAFASRPCSTIGEYSAMFAETRAIEQALADEIQTREEQLESLRDPAASQESEFNRLRCRCYPKGIWKAVEWFRRQIGDLEAVLTALRVQLEELRNIKGRIARLEFEIDVLRNAQQQLAKERATECSRLERAVDSLSPLVAVLHSERTPLIAAVDIDAVLGRLLEMAVTGEQDTEALVELLSSQVQQVTIHGLAKITQADEVRAASIARELVEAESAVDGPPWGGDRGYAACSRVHVLPPVSAELAEEIATHVKQLDETATLLCGDVASGGVNVVQLEIFSPRVESQVFTKFLAKNLEVACESPQLYFPNGMPCVEELEFFEMPAGDVAKTPVHPK